MPEAQQIREMFARLAPRYDRANHVLSMGVDWLWRRAAVRAGGEVRGQRVLDVCAGTGDLSFEFARAGARVVGADFCPEMLDRTRRKGSRSFARPSFCAADTLELPFAPHTFDVVAVSFGIRNVSDPRRALAEMARVARPGGRIVVLEFARPCLPVLGPIYQLYFRRLVPHLGRWITGDREGAYSYLPESVSTFPERQAFLEVMRSAGLESASFRSLTGGIAALYRAETPT